MLKKVTSKYFENIKDSIKTEVIRIIVLMVILNVIMWLFNPAVYSSPDKTLLTISNLAVAGSFVIMLMVTCFAKLITRPVFIRINIVNKASGEPFTQLFHNSRERDDKVTIQIKTSFESGSSLWTGIALRILRDKKITLHVHDDKHFSHITCQPLCQTSEVRLFNNGFCIDIGYLLVNNLKDGVDHKKDYEFIIRENRDAPMQANEEIPVKPTLRINNRKPGFLMRLLIIQMKIDTYPGWHNIYFIK